MSLLRHPLVLRIRRNHALEHAIMHLLSQRDPSLRLVGHSDWNGISLYGEVDTPAVVRAAEQGLARLRAGEVWLRLHPRCGTNFAVGMFLGGCAIYAATETSRKSIVRRLLRMGAYLMGALFVAQPLGMLVQRHVTTAPSMNDVQIKEIRKQQRAGTTIHRIVTA
ncbi:MAG: DUF6391 domain-containing protein [Chloroflexota bacterium]|nr:DUF6391 domain-containing protein [Chloroflexota bacterium]